MLEFPDLLQTKNELIDDLTSKNEIPSSDVTVIASPYRICPLGAHIDHQGGPVLGMTINACSLMAFYPSDNSIIELCSKNYPGKVSFNLGNIPGPTGSFWGSYPQAAALALQEKYSLERGVVGLVDGMLPGCGLSSSASVLLAYLYAFATANSIELKPWDYVRLARRAENNYIGLNNGILDQTSIVFGRRDHMLYIDTKKETISFLPDQLGEGQYRILVAYSGYSRELTTSGYNTRVDECRSAAKQLSQMSGSTPAQILSDVNQDVFLRFGHKLEPHIGKRARHYFDETQRVHAGIAAWNNGSIEELGHMMSESCKSSMEQYECGIQAIHDLQQIVSTADGVFGSRFMGGGFGGCVVGFVEPSKAAMAADDVRETYRQLHPEVAKQAAVYLAQTDEGIRFL